MFQAAKLWERTSAKGDRYLVGRMGGVRVLVMLNKRRDGDGDASHVLMFTEAPAYDGARAQAAPAEPAEPSHATAPANGRAHRNGKRPRLVGEDEPLIDDPVPF